MLLGDLLARFDDPAIAADTLLSLDDLSLAARVGDAAAECGLTPGAFVRAAVRHFATVASDEDWVTVMGQMGRAADPGRVLLRRALVAALAAEAPSREP